MKTLLALTFVVILSMQPATTFARTKQDKSGANLENCALTSQRAVAKHHGLSIAADDSFSLKIYADPQLSQEADEAFDQCVRKQSQ